MGDPVQLELDFGSPSTTFVEGTGELLDINALRRERAAQYQKEEDPNGLDQHTPGAKLDAGKVRMDLMLHGFARALVEVGKVTTYGAQKYTDNGWAAVSNGVARYSDAMQRHYMQEATEGEMDTDGSGLMHAAQVAWNALARLELMLRERKA